MKIKELVTYWNQILKENEIDESLLKVQIILANLLNVSREYIYIFSENDVDKNIQEEFEQKMNLILSNEPFQYVLGFQEFMGLKFLVDKRCINT